MLYKGIYFHVFPCFFIYFIEPGCLDSGIGYPEAVFGGTIWWYETANATAYSCQGECQKNKLCVAATFNYNPTDDIWECRLLSRIGWYFDDLRHKGVTVLRECYDDFSFDSNGWYTKGGSSYHFDHGPNSGITQESAESQCQALGARLITLEEITELVTIRNYIMHLAMDGNVALNDRYMVGMHRSNMTWSNGVSVYYVDWYTSQPNGDNVSQPIISLQRGYGMQFADYAVGGNHGFICEKGGESCPSPSLAFEEFDYRHYMFFSLNYTFSSATDLCKGLNSQLMVFHSEIERVYFIERINNATAPQPTTVWPGLVILKPGDTSCTNETCNSQLQWANGNLYLHRSWHGPVVIGPSDDCILFDLTAEVFVTSQSWCDTQEWGFMCQSECAIIGCRFLPYFPDGESQALAGGNRRYACMVVLRLAKKYPL